MHVFKTIIATVILVLCGTAIFLLIVVASIPPAKVEVLTTKQQCERARKSWGFSREDMLAGCPFNPGAKCCIAGNL
jgi:hypothetical protein